MNTVPRVMLALVSLWAGTASAGETDLDGLAERLRGEYRGAFAAAAGDGELPFTVEARREDGTVRSRALLFLARTPFDRFVEVFDDVHGWCQSLLLHLNVKTCVAQEIDDPGLALYLGRKYYAEPADAIHIAFGFRAVAADEAMRVTLEADQGPFGTSRYRFVLGAVKVDDGVFIELTLSSHEGYAGTVLDVYLNTLGRSKVGFTRTGTTLFGNPEYVRGQEGAAERNVVRYLLALRTTLETADTPFAERAAAWFDATEEYARQLHELPRDTYLENKAREYANQLRYQAATDRGESVDRFDPGKNR